MALENFDLAALLKRMGIFADPEPPPSWMTNPHVTIDKPEPTSAIPQIGGKPWYQATPDMPQAFVDPEAEARSLQNQREAYGEGLQGPKLEDIQVHQPQLIGPKVSDIQWQQEIPNRPDPHYALQVGEPQMPPQYDVQVGAPKIEHGDDHQRKRKAALASMRGL
jgi:hypothetical protein